MNVAQLTRSTLTPLASPFLAACLVSVPVLLIPSFLLIRELLLVLNMTSFLLVAVLLRYNSGTELLTHRKCERLGPLHCLHTCTPVGTISIRTFLLPHKETLCPLALTAPHTPHGPPALMTGLLSVSVAPIALDTCCEWDRSRGGLCDGVFHAA